MQIVVVADEAQWQYLSGLGQGIAWVKADEPFQFSQYPAAAAFFIVKENDTVQFPLSSAPIFINSVCTTLTELNAPGQVVRINGWETFLQRPLWEVAGMVNDTVTNILTALNKQYLPVQDEPGLVAARVIAMIINEAFFTLGDAVSSTTDIDTAMKLGTNYPYGPFEWAEKIGVKNIITLLQKLQAADNRYTPAPRLLAADTVST
ncbi:MAG: hypothetical protein JST86_07720 [Bacteroidetes bacterium]|nr:hypothetical protein [Bacteroidota bacterium]